MTQPRLGYDNLGLGLGLRTTHFAHILDHNPSVDWFEIISENFMDSGGRPRYVLEQIAERYPIVMHGVSMSIGSTDPLDFDYLRKLRDLQAATGAHWISDHLCWTGVATKNTHDLLPLPYNAKSLRHCIERVHAVQEFLGRPLVLENPSTYVTFRESTMDEWDFLTELAEATDCGLLLDVNNVYVSSFNHDMNPQQFIESLPHERIVQFHLAGHTNYDTHLIDTHDHPVIDPVWQLYKLAHKLTGGVSTLLEWDADIPPFEVLHAEVLKARHHMDEQLEPVGASAAVESPVVADASQPAPHPLHHVLPEVE